MNTYTSITLLRRSVFLSRTIIAERRGEAHVMLEQQEEVEHGALSAALTRPGLVS